MPRRQFVSSCPTIVKPWLVLLLTRLAQQILCDSFALPSRPSPQLQHCKRTLHPQPRQLTTKPRGYMPSPLLDRRKPSQHVVVLHHFSHPLHSSLIVGVPRILQQCSQMMLANASFSSPPNTQSISLPRLRLCDGNHFKKPHLAYRSPQQRHNTSLGCATLLSHL